MAQEIYLPDVDETVVFPDDMSDNDIEFNIRSQVYHEFHPQNPIPFIAEKTFPIVKKAYEDAAMEDYKGVPQGWNEKREKEFKEWYDVWRNQEEALAVPMPEDPDDPTARYNFRRAFVEEGVPEINFATNKLEWPAEFRTPDNPDFWKGREKELEYLQNQYRSDLEGVSLYPADKPAGEAPKGKLARAVKDFRERQERLTPEDAAKAMVQLQGGPSVGNKLDQIQKFNERLLDSFVSGALTVEAGTVRGLEWMTKSELAKEVADLGDELAKKHLPPDPTLLDEIASGFGSMAAFFLPGMGVQAGLTKLAAVAPSVAKWTGLGVMSSLEAMSEAGFVYKEILDRTKNQDAADTAATKTFLMNIALITSTNKLGIFGEQGRMVRRAIMSMAMEGSQEGLQEVVSALAQGDPINLMNVIKATGIGAIVAGPTGLAQSAYESTVGEKLREEEAWNLTQEAKEKILKRLEKEKAKIEKEAKIPFTEEEEAQIQKEAKAEIKKPVAPKVPETVEQMKKQREGILKDANALREAGDLINAAKEIQKAHKLRTQIEKQEKVEQKPEEQVQEKVMLSLAEKKPQEISKGLDKKLVKEIAQTKNFKDWFGKSKVVDEEGNPQQMFHGTPKNFTVFDLSKSDIGFHVGNVEQANNIATPPWMNKYIESRVIPKGKKGLNIMPVVIKAENSLRLDDVGDWDSPIAVTNELYNKGIVPDRAIDAFRDKIFGLETKQKWDEAFSIIRGQLKKLGYDSIVYENTVEGKGDSYILFDPEQIKSVYNAGSFDIKTPVISLSATQKSALEKARARAYEQAKKGVKQGLPYEKIEQELLEQRLNNAGAIIKDALENVVKIPKAMKARMGIRVVEKINIEDLNKASVAASVASYQAKGIDPYNSRILGYASITPEYAGITLALDDPASMLKEAFEEYYHIIEEWMFKDKNLNPTPELKLLEKTVSPDFEDRAKAFKAFMLGELQGTKAQRSVWQKIVDFLKELKAALLSNGYNSSEDIFGGIVKGVYKPKFSAVQLQKELQQKPKAPSVTPSVEETVNSTARKQEIQNVIKKLKKTWLSVEDGDSIRDDWQDPMPGIVDIPELIEIVREVNEGKLPRIVKEFRKRGQLGVFSPGKGVIKLKADIFKDPKLAQETLSRMVGHLVDWVPDKTLARGNILGRIASLRAHTARVLPKYKGAIGDLTEADRHRFRLEAEAVAKKESIEAKLEKELGITVKQALDIWNNLKDSRSLNPELYNFIAIADVQTKKLIIKDALKGVASKDLKAFAEEELEKKVKPTNKAVAQKLAKLVNKEIQKRQLWIADEITDELKKLTRIWRPFNPASNPAYTKFRYSSKELYADAVSVLFSSPQLMKQQAPKFYEAFFLYMDEKPLVRKMYDDVQRRIRAGTTLADLTERTYKMIDDGNTKLIDMLMLNDLPKRDKFMRDFIDMYHMVLKDVKAVNEQSIPSNENPRYKIEDMSYTGSEIEGLVDEVYHNVIKPLNKANLDWDKEFGLLGFLERVAFERAALANPRGWDGAKALRKIDAMKNKELTENQWNLLTQALSAFREIHDKYFVQKAEKLNIFDPKMIELFKSREKYLALDVQDYLSNKYGRAAALKIYEQTGTFRDVINPATATLLKDIGFIKAANRNEAVKSTLKFYQRQETIDQLGETVEKAKKVWDANLKKRVYQESDDPKKRLMTYLEKGEMHGFYIDKYIAEAFDSNPYYANIGVNILQGLSNPFRKVFTEYHYGFWMFNIWRDYKRAVHALPGASYINFLPTYIKGINPAFRSVFGVSPDVIDEMRQGNMLISVEEMLDLEHGDKAIEKMLRRKHLRPKEWDNQIVRPFGQLFNWVTAAPRFFSNVGKGFERTTKVAGYKFLKEHFPDMPQEVVAHIVRTRAGSPDFLRRGRLHPIYNNLLLFSNAMKEGYRGDWESMKDSQNAFWYKKAKYVFLPKFLMFMAKIGLLDLGVNKLRDVFGDEIPEACGEDASIQRVMEGVSEYDLTNYTVIPLGLTSSCKSVYLRIPLDETSRLMGGIAWKALNHKELGYSEMAKGMFDYMAGQAPTWNPGITLGGNIIDFISGRNPYDKFYDRYAVPEEEFKVGGTTALKAFGKYLMSKMGVLNVYNFKEEDYEKIVGELENILGFPLNTSVPEWMIKIPGKPGLHNSLGRFVKVSDYGIKEKVKRGLRVKVQRPNAKAIVESKQAVYKILRGETPESSDLMKMALKPDVVSNAVIVALARKYGLVYYEMYRTAATKEEKAYILGELLKKSGLPENIFEVTPTAKAQELIKQIEKGEK